MKVKNILIVGLLIISGNLRADLYKWVDESGKVHFSDKKQNESSEQVIQVSEPNIDASISKNDTAIAKKEVSPAAEASTVSHLFPAIPYGNVNSCELQMLSCESSEIGCVSLGVPDKTATCNSFCQEVIIKKLTTAMVSVYTNSKIHSPSAPRGCVGYRADMGGTEEGAKCIARILNYEYMKEGCNSDGWPYNVRVN